jgi:hypothetical protein
MFCLQPHDPTKLRLLCGQASSAHASLFCMASKASPFCITNCNNFQYIEELFPCLEHAYTEHCFSPI